MRVLIIDDDQVTREKAAQFFVGYGETVKAATGREGFDHFKNSVFKQTYFDLMLIDIHLPDISGLDLVNLIVRKEKKLNIAPSAKWIVTSHASVDNVKKATQAGCSGFLSKPLKAEVVLDKIRKAGLALEKEETPELPKPQSIDSQPFTISAREEQQNLSPVEKIHERKKYLFRLCRGDRTMDLFMEAISEFEIGKLSHEK